MLVAWFALRTDSNFQPAFQPVIIIIYFDFNTITFYRIYLINGSIAVCSQFQNVQNSRKRKMFYFYVKMYILVLRSNHWRRLFVDFLRISQFLFRNKTTKCASKDFKKTQKDVYSSTTKYKKSRPFLISNDKLIWRF